MDIPTNTGFSTPILFCIFNRPDTTQQVFDRIREVKPKRLYVSSDAPRPHKEGESEKCREAREIIKQVDWDCEVKALFQETNQGCKKAISQAITRFFEEEEYGIILEDDCLPDISFFPFCEELLIKYKDNERIGHISGNCFFPHLVGENESYTFASIPHIWGWATWRRVWENFDIDFAYWNNTPSKERKQLFNSKLEEIYFSSFLSDTLQEKHGINAWSPQYVYMLRLLKQFSIYPAVNLVSNIGLNTEGATHVSWKNKQNYIPLALISFPLHHPNCISLNKQLDKYTIRKKFFSWKRLVRYFLNDY